MEKEEFKNYVHLQQEVEDLQENIEKLRSQAKSVCATRLSAAPAGSGSPDKIAANLAKIDSLMEYYLDKLENKLEQQKKVESAIEVLSGNERMLMRYRYIDGLDWIDVAAKMNYSWQHTHRIHAKALAKLKDEIECDS